VSCHIGLSAGEIPHAKIIKRLIACIATRPLISKAASIELLLNANHAMDPTIYGRQKTESAVGRINVSGVCGKCHDEALIQFSASAHGGVPGTGRSGLLVCNMPWCAQYRSGRK